MRLILLLLASSPALASAGVHYEFQYFTGRSGHRVVEVNDIDETPDGAIWASTWGDGVHRIHNTKYKNYTTSDGMAANWFRGIEYVGGKTVWAHTRGIIPFIDGRVQKTLMEEETAELPDNDLRVVHALSDGRVLAVTSEGRTLLFESKNGIAIPTKWSDIATRETFQDSSPISFLELPNGKILASVEQRGIYQLDGTVWKFVWGEGKSWLLKKTNYNGTVEVSAAHMGGYAIHQLKGGIWEKISTSPERMFCFLPLPDNEILIGSTAGVHKFSAGRWSPLEFPAGIGTPFVRTILRGSNGTLWIGAYEGLIRGLPRTWQGNFTTDDGVKLVSLVRNRDDASQVWFVDEKQRLVRYEDSELHAFLQLQTTSKFEIGVFAFRNEDSVWGMWHNKLQRFSLLDGSLEREWSNLKGGINLCKTANAGHVFLTSHGAFVLREDKWVEFPVIDGYQRKGIFDLVELENGVILAAVENGVELWKDDRVEHLKGTIHDFQSIHVKPTGQIWLGSLGQGVMRFDGIAVVQSGDFGASDNRLVTNIYESRDGTLWASLRRGGIVSLRDGRRVTYRYNHGLPNKGINCIREDEQGKVWVSVNEGGVYAFRPDKSPPDTRILDPADDVSSHGIASFSFSGWDAWGRTPRDRLVYSWRVLTEPDGDVVLPWSNGSRATLAVTKALDPGGYRLEVRAADQDRNVDPTPATFAFQVQYPIWRQAAFMAPLSGLSLSMIAACFLWYKSRQRRLHVEFERSHLERHADELKVAMAESEQRFQRVFEEGPIGLALFGTDFRTIKVNPALCQMLGYTEDELLAIDVLDITHPDDLAEDLALAEKLFSGEIPLYHLEKRYIKKNGELIWGNLVASLVRDENGESLYGIGMVEDITERKLARETLEKNEEQYRTLTENSQDYILRYDREYRHTFANRAALRISGKTSAEFIGKTHREMGFPDHLCQFWENAIDRVFATNQPQGEIFDWNSLEGTATYDWRVFPELNSDGEVVSVLGVSRDISKLKQVTDELRESETRFREIANAIDDVAWITDWVDHKTIYASPAYEKIWGRSVEDLYANPTDWADAIHPEDRQRAWDTFLQLGEGDSYDEEYRITRPDGSVRWIRDRGFPIRDDKGQVSRVAGLAQDITELKQAEQELQLSAEIMENMAEGVCVLRASDSHFVFTNPRFDEIFGYETGELTGQHAAILIAPSEVTPQETADRILQDLAEKGVWSGHVHTIRKDGTPFWTHSSVSTLENPQHGLVNIAVVEDVTERKRAEDALRESEEKYRTLVESSPFCIHQIDFRGRLMSMNRAGLQMIGEEDESVIVGTPYLSAVCDEDRERTSSLLDAALAGEYSEFEFRGTVGLEFLSNFVPVYDADGKIDRLLGITQDVTERKRIEEALQESEEKSRLLLNSTGEAIYGLDLEGNCTFCNPSCLQLLGYEDESQLLGRNMHDLIHHTRPDGSTYPEDQCLIYVAFREGQATHIDNELLWRADGTSFAAEYRSFPIVRDGKTVGSVVSFVDITVRKRAEKALRESEASYRRLAKVMPTAMYTCDTGGQITYFNDQAAKLWGRKPNIGDFDEQFCGSFRMYLPDGSLLSHENSPMHAALNDGHTFRNQEVIIERPDNSRITVLVNIEPIVDTTGNRIGAINVFIDVTELRRAQESLRISEERLNLAVRGTSDGLWDWDCETGKEYWSPRFKELLGYGEDEIEATFDQFQELLHPEDLADVLEAVRLHLEDGQPYDREFRMRTKCGEYKWFQSRGEALRDENGRPHRMAGSVRDITERKQAEEELRELQEKLAHVARLSTMGEMATGIAHELNQPLTAITTYSHIVKHMLNATTADQQEIQQTLDKLESQALRAGDIVWRLRNFVKKSPSNRVSTDLNALIKDVARFVDLDIRQAEISLQLSLDDSCPSANVDAIQIQQVLVNLLRNAIDAMDETPIDRRTVTVTTQIREDDFLDVLVCDAGRGLNGDEFDLVFDAFYSSRQEGMGMGLAISRSIVEDHGGRLWAEANHTTGTTFRFTIPHGDSHGGAK